MEYIDDTDSDFFKLARIKMLSNNLNLLSIDGIIRNIPLIKSMGYSEPYGVYLKGNLCCSGGVFLDKPFKNPEKNLVFDALIMMIKNVKVIHNSVFLLIRVHLKFCHYKTHLIIEELNNRMKNCIDFAVGFTFCDDIIRIIYTFLDFDTRIKELEILRNFIEETMFLHYLYFGFSRAEDIYKVSTCTLRNYSELEKSDPLILLNPNFDPYKNFVN